MKNAKKVNEKIRMIVTVGLLIALTIVLDRPPLSFSTNGWKIGFAFVPVVISAVLFGPVISGVTYALADLLAANLFPTGPYFPGFTVTAALMGAAYGLLLYRKNGDWTEQSKASRMLRVVLSAVINCILGMFLNTAWIAILYGSRTYWGWFVYRIPQYAVIVPISIVLIPIVIRLCGKIKKNIYG